MNLTQLEYFLAVAKELNFTNAAKSLFISQPALSKQILLLEKELDTQLLVRSPKKVSLTHAGEVLQQNAEHLLQELGEIRVRVWNAGHEKKTLRVGCFDGAYSGDFLPQFYQAMDEAAPEIEIVFSKFTFQGAREAFFRKELDLIFTLDFEMDTLADYPHAVIAKRDGAFLYSDRSPLAGKENLTLEDFASQPYLIMSSENSSAGYRRSLERLKKLGINPPKIIMMKDMSTLLSFLELGRGVTILDRNVAERRKGFYSWEVGDADRMYVVAVWQKDLPVLQTLMETLFLKTKE